MARMDSLRNKEGYLSELKKRAKESRAYKKHQLIGLEIADILDDRRHTSLYIKLAKEHRADVLLQLAKSVSGKSGVKNPGAYFMKIISGEERIKRIP